MSRAAKIFATLTPDEQAYFIASTDIFHDTPYSCHGRPSQSRVRQVTVTYNYEQNISISSFPSLNNTQPWDANFVSFPWVSTHSFTAVNDNGSIMVQPTNITFDNFGGLTSCATQTGTTWTPASLGATSYLPPSGPLSVTSSQWPTYPVGPYERFQYEVISAGYEIVNTTPELYQGGALIRYRVPTGSMTGAIVSSAFTGITQMNVFPLPPTTPSLAMLYPDSILDKASEGTYQMHTRQCDSQRRFSGPDPIEVYSPTINALDGGSFVSKYIFTQASGVANSPVLLSDFDTIGTYCTGLSPQTTLALRYRVIISFTPASYDATLVSLATESPPYNPKLDELISLIQMELSPGVPVHQNAKGDWWRTVLEYTAKFAPVMGATFGPQGALIGSGLGALASVINANVPRQISSSPPNLKPNQKPQQRSSRTIASKAKINGERRVQPQPKTSAISKRQLQAINRSLAI